MEEPVQFTVNIPPGVPLGDQGLIPLVRPLIEELHETTNMYLNEELIQRICRLAGE